MARPLSGRRTVEIVIWFGLVRNYCFRWFSVVSVMSYDTSRFLDFLDVLGSPRADIDYVVI